MYFNKGNWNNLTVLSLISNKIGNKGCKLLTSNAFKSIRLLALGMFQHYIIDDNQIGSTGVLHLSKAKWPPL